MPGVAGDLPGHVDAAAAGLPAVFVVPEAVDEHTDAVAGGRVGPGQGLPVEATG